MRCDLHPTGRREGAQFEVACAREGCGNTAWIAVDPAKFRMQCGVTSEGPGLVRRAFHFASALAVHAGDGFAKRTRAEIHDLLAACRECEHFTGDSCAKCGCTVAADEVLFNKLAWRSEKCPEGKW